MRKIVYRSKESGQFVSEETARAHPEEHIFDEVDVDGTKHVAGSVSVPADAFKGMTVSELVGNFDLTGMTLGTFDDVDGYDILVIKHPFGSTIAEAIAEAAAAADAEFSD